MKVKEESEKVGLKLNIQKIKIMASGPITSWEIDGETVETVADFILGAPKSLQMVSAALGQGPGSPARDQFSSVTQLLTAGKKSYDQPRQHIKKQRHYFANKGSSSRGYGFFQ